MFDAEFAVDFAMALANGALSFRYSEHFLSGKYTVRRRALTLWVLLYAAGHLLYGQTVDTGSVGGRFMRIVFYLCLLTFLQCRFFVKDRPRQAFILTSFIAGFEILRFIASPLSHAILSLWGPLWANLAEHAVMQNPQSAATVMANMTTLNNIILWTVICFCRAVQLCIFILYLRLIAKYFIGMTDELKMRESLYLIFPCITVLCLNFTMRLMAYSNDNNAVTLIYERVPETLILLPTVSVFMLCIIVTTVMLFRGLVRYKNEERKRLLLENSIADIRRQTTELSAVYKDMRGLRHDLAGHIANIAAFVKNRIGENSELDGYLDNLHQVTKRLDVAENTGNPITDIIIHKARQHAKGAGISFAADFRFPAVQAIDVYDISVILNNALQNAAEACEKLTGQRWIKVRSYERGNLFFTEVINDFDGNILWHQGSDLPATIKAEAEFHGIGLLNISRTAEKYRGAVDVEIIGKNDSTEPGKHPQFCLTVMLLKRTEK